MKISVHCVSAFSWMHFLLVSKHLLPHGPLLSLQLCLQSKCVFACHLCFCLFVGFVVRCFTKTQDIYSHPHIPPLSSEPLITVFTDHVFEHFSQTFPKHTTLWKCLTCIPFDQRIIYFSKQTSV